MSREPRALDEARLLQAELRAGLARAGDPTRARQQQRYLKSTMPCAGVAMPEVRRIARRVGTEHVLATRTAYESGLTVVWDEAEVREERHAVVTLTGLRQYAQWQDPELIPFYRHFVATGAWWDLVDDIAVHRVAPLRRAFPSAVDPVIRAWADDDDLWLRRSAVLSQVGARGDVDRTLLVDVLEPNLASRETFLRKAVGWALRDLAPYDPDWVRAYVTEHQDRLSPLSLREATRRLPGG